LARKSLEKAKKLALSVAKQNLLSNTLEGAESVSGLLAVPVVIFELLTFILIAA
jgi:hypothetical protein